MKNTQDKVPKVKPFATHRKAFQDYTVLSRYEAGIELRGTEVKSIRGAQVSLAGSYAAMEGDQLILRNLNIPHYEFGNQLNHAPMRNRRLLLHRHELDKLRAQVEQKGCTIIPLTLYPKHGLIKVELGLCKGKNRGDKRETLRRKTADREAHRAMAQHRR